jgi:hypothetical protein
VFRRKLRLKDQEPGENAMSSKIKNIAAFALVLIAGAALPTHADVARRHGGLCAPKYTSRDLVGVDERGIYNGSTTATASVTCPATDRVSHRSIWVYPDRGDEEKTPLTATISSVVVYGRDLSGATPFSCYVFATEDEGFSSWGPTRYTCGQPGGCSSSANEFTGTFSLKFPLDNFASDKEHIGVVCNIPSTTPAGSSYVKSVKIEDGTREYLFFQPEGPAQFVIDHW